MNTVSQTCLSLLVAVMRSLWCRLRSTEEYSWENVWPRTSALWTVRVTSYPCWTGSALESVSVAWRLRTVCFRRCRLVTKTSNLTWQPAIHVFGVSQLLYKCWYCQPIQKKTPTNTSSEARLPNRALFSNRLRKSLFGRLWNSFNIGLPPFLIIYL